MLILQKYETSEPAKGRLALNQKKHYQESEPMKKDNFLCVIKKTLLLLGMFMMSILLFQSCSSYNHGSYSHRIRNSLDSLDMLLTQRQTLLEAKEKALKKSIKEMAKAERNGMPLTEQYASYKKLYYESHLFTFNYSIIFTRKMLAIADALGDPGKQVEAKTLYGYSLARGGLYKEAIDTLETIKPASSLPDSILYKYYLQTGRAYHDLAAYEGSVYSNGVFHKFKPGEMKPLYVDFYVKKGNEMLSKALHYAHNKTDIYYLKGKIYYFQNRPKEACMMYLQALESCPKDCAERKSILYSTICMIYGRLGQEEASTYYCLLALNNDIANSINETNAPGFLAENFYKFYKDINRSSDLLDLAMDDAIYYGSRYRINLMGSYLPSVLNQKKELQESRRHILMFSSCMAVFVIILFLLVRKLKRESSNLARNRAELIESNQNLDDANKQLIDTNRMLDDANHNLADANKHLNEVTRLKNHYLGHYMDKDQEIVNAINDFTLLASQKLSMKQFRSLEKLISDFRKNYDRKKELADFDRTIIQIFPTFIDDFNKLMKEEGHQSLTSPDTLTPTLRIFALVRLGITTSDRIAKVLGYTYNTVYNYRIRTRNKAINPDSFEDDIAKIGL